MNEVVRAEVMETRTHPALRFLCHQAKNLYNRALYLYKQEKGKGKHLNYYQLDKILKHEQCYSFLPAHTAQHTLKLLLRDWKAFYQARKEFAKHPTKFLGPPKPPKYKKPKGEMVAIITNQQTRIREGYLLLPKKVGWKIRTRLTSIDKVKEVRIVPRGVGYTVEIVYHKHLPKKVQKKIRRKGALDLGLTNLVTFVDNIGSRPIVVKDEGKGIKSITQYYLKRVKKLQEQYAQQQYQQLKKQNRLVYGSTYYRLKETWRRKMKECFHQLSRFLVNLWKERELHTIYVGYNPLWKQQVRLRRKTTQMFVMVPFHHLIKLLEYKAAEEGITVELVDESYTSKCSFLDNEQVEKLSFYKGRRVLRGLFRSAQGQLFNADVNAAYNILVKSDPQAVPTRTVGGVGGYVIYPLRVSYQAMKL
ncbi:MAG: RNA-guided endonuclease InsQ/TnpB family protein [Candidatus Heimdallarchaeaceae archaeon]